MVSSHVIEERPGAGDLGGAGETEQRRQQAAADNDCDGGYDELNRGHRRALGVLVTRLFELLGRKCRPIRPRSPPASSRSVAAWR
jgi:hypothetical protein